MKKLLFLVVFALVGFTAAAQGVIVVNSAEVFESMASFKAAEAELKSLGEARQAEIGAQFAQIETLYNSYMQQKAVLGEAARAQQEQNIIDRETAASKRQEEVFGPDGELAKRRETLMTPIQERVESVVGSYASKRGVAVVLEKEQALWMSPTADVTQEIINLLK